MPGHSLGSSIKHPRQYEGLRRKRMSKARSARLSNSPGASRRGGKRSHSRSRRSTR